MVDFDPCCLFHFVVVRNDNQISWNALLFLCNLIVQLCLGGPGYIYSSRIILIVNYEDILIIIYLRKTLNRP